MLRDVYWRQYPVDLLSDDKMACVEAMLPDELKYLPYMIYITALKLCDDNGVFDLDDGVVFARLTRCKDIATVFEVVNLMRQRKILYRLFDNSMLCGLVDWTYSDKKARTIEERRKLVLDRIEKEKAKNVSNLDFPINGRAGICNDIPQSAGCVGKCNDIPQTEKSCAGKHNDVPQTTDSRVGRYNDIPQAANGNDNGASVENAGQTDLQAGTFLLSENDKNCESVAKTVFDDKNAKNVVKTQTVQYSTDNTIQTAHTHIQQASGYAPIEGAPPDACPEQPDVAVKTYEQTKNSNNENTSEDACGGEAISTLAEQALLEAQKGDENSDTGELVAYLNEFFVKNCYGYKAKQSANAVSKLADEIMQLSDAVNPPEVVASVLCSEFKKMCDGQRESYWKGMPLLPANMIKPRALSELIQYAGKILATSQNGSKFLSAAEKAQKDYEAEKDLVGDAMREEFLKYNIDPDDLQAQRKLLMAKAKEAEAARQAVEASAYDIF